MFRQVSRAEPSPCKTPLFVFLKVAQNYPPNVKGSRKSLMRAEYHGLLRSVVARSNQGRNDGGQGARFPGRRKVQTMSQVLQYTTFASGRPQVRTCGRQTCFSPRAPSNLVTPLTVIQYSSALSMYIK